MLRPALITAILSVVLLGNAAFTKRSRTMVLGEGIASGDISFSIHAEGENTNGEIRYGNVVAPVQSLAFTANGKMATIYFKYRETILAVTVIDGKRKNPDRISDPFPAEEQQKPSVVPRLSYNTVTSGEISLRSH